MRTALPWLLLVLACGDTEPETAPTANEKCPNIAVDKLDGQWVRVAGSAGDTSHRFEVKDAPGGGYTATFILGGFERLKATGVVRKSAVIFTEDLTDAQLKKFNQGQRLKRQLYIEPRLQSCSLRIR